MSGRAEYKPTTAHLFPKNSVCHLLTVCVEVLEAVKLARLK